MEDRCEAIDVEDNATQGGSANGVEIDASGASDEHDVPVVEGQSTTKTQGSADLNNVQYMSPIHTLRSSDTVVGSNQMGGVNYLEPPRVGMVFKSWQDVEAYYKAYAEQQGFGVTRAQGVYSKGEVRERVSTTWRCECWGRPDMRARREAQKRAKSMDVSGSGGVVGGVVSAEELSQRKRKSKKCECQTKVYASVNRGGEWVIKTVNLEHSNHTPTPGKARLVKEYRMKKFNTRARKQLFKFFDEGVTVRQIHGCLASEAVGDGNPEWTVKDLQHEVYKARRLKTVGGDSAAMMSYFKKMKEVDQNFYHAQRLDSEGRLKDVIWVDARSRAAYEEFGDVVCFDATYLTNEYQLPFVNFVGVNHHGQSILLGCALVAREDCDTFKWIFQQWLCCMNNRAPAAILTDQAAAMRKPLEEVMPFTRHRWCIWHIMRKIPEKLGKCARYRDFKGVLKAVVYESLDGEEFESKWLALIADFGLESNDWLTGLYKERHMWVPAFMREYFWAGMKTTQRVESINSFFDGYVKRNTQLHEFPHKYGKALEKRLRDEAAADANCAKYIRRLVTGFHVEKFFQTLYTDTKFQEVQTECSRMMYCYCKEENILDENTVQYVLEDRVWVVPEGRSEEIITNRRRCYSVTYYRKTKEVSCNCMKFVTHGIMCKHMMRVLDQNHVVPIPEKYIVNRWRKDIPRKHSRVRVAYHDPNKSVVVKRYNKLMAEFEALCDGASLVSDEAVELVITALKNIYLEVEKCKVKNGQESISINSCPDASIYTGMPVSPNTNTSDTVHKPQQDNPESCPSSCEFIIKDPIVPKRGRGRPKSAREKTLAEMCFRKPGDKGKTTSVKGGKGKTSKVKGGSKNDMCKEKGRASNTKNCGDVEKNKGKLNKKEASKTNAKGRTNKNSSKSTAKVTLTNISKATKKKLKVAKVKMLKDLVPITNVVQKKLSKKRKSSAKCESGRPAKEMKVV